MQYHELQQNGMDKAENSGKRRHVCSETSLELCTKPFSMRQYVLLSRQRNIFQNWPFPEKYLKLCLEYGVTNVLPPLEVRGLLESTGISYEKGKVTNAEDDHVASFKTTLSMVSEQVQLMSLSCNELNQEKEHPSDVHYPRDKNTYKVTKNCSTIVAREGKIFRKWRRKMKTVAEIFATAKHCSLENVDKMNGLTCTSDKDGEQRQKIQVDLEYYCDSKSDITDDGADYKNRLPKRRPVLKY